jgi:riboflavin kinase/FMN adenylyltransferase
MTAEEFVDRVFVQCLGIRGLVLGHDTALGKDRLGDAPKLRELGSVFGFEVQIVGQIAVNGIVASSSKIRETLEVGDLEAASRLLGRHPSLLGEVIEGERRGTAIGFPTANLDPAAAGCPGDGVYACLALFDQQRHEAVCNIGVRPTFHRAGRRLLEVHLLDFEGDLYGKQMEVVFLARLRGELRFCDVEALRAQILQDKEMAREIFRHTRGGLSGRFA